MKGVSAVSGGHAFGGRQVSLAFEPEGLEGGNVEIAPVLTKPPSATLHAIAQDITRPCARSLCSVRGAQACAILSTGSGSLSHWSAKIPLFISITPALRPTPTRDGS